MRLLERAGKNRQVLDIRKAPRVGQWFGLPGLENNFNPFFEARAALVLWNSHAVEFEREQAASGTELQALAFTTEASRTYMSTFRRDGASVKQQLDQRDSAFGDYRTRKT